ncbi:MAG: 4-hydroxy-3-methylbut-2-enyl diphosphate reductase [Acidobacteria bacterium]|nr:4-hydroxy-3-methylbut-2-enyl diphosphate reductase [Acidobacteriota bacterium]
MEEDRYHRKGFGLRSGIQETLRRDYHSLLVDRMKARGGSLAVRDLTIRLAAEFGFCYGVDRAVEYAYETRRKFPDRRLFITGEIIHNPHVNSRLRDMGVRFLSDAESFPAALAEIRPEDVVIIPAFGATTDQMAALREKGCVRVDTTCGSVLNVWKNVERYARDGFTSVIHGKYHHEETRATASRATRHPGGHYLVVRDMEEAVAVGGFVRDGGNPEAFLRRFGQAASPGFDPARDLEKVGLANQTTMLSSESLAIDARLKEAYRARYGEERLADHFRSFDTICSATQDRQDAVEKLLEGGVDLMVVIGGYNSSNTNHLAEIASRRVPTFHIQDAACIDGAGRIRHKPVRAPEVTVTEAWLPPGPVTVGLTAGASTPNNKIGEVAERILECRGYALAEAGP